MLDEIRVPPLCPLDKGQDYASPGPVTLGSLGPAYGVLIKGCVVSLGSLHSGHLANTSLDRAILAPQGLLVLRKGRKVLCLVLSYSVPQNH
jgi:hypothetical protein